MEEISLFTSLDGNRDMTCFTSKRFQGINENCANKFVTTSSVHLTVNLRVPEIPKEGRHLRAGNAISSPGGGYVVAAAARAQGVESWIASPLGTGPNSHEIRRRMIFDDIRAPAAAVVGDVGVAVAMIEEDGKTASVIAPGVETEISTQLLDSITLGSGDLVHICGGDLVGNAQSEVLTQWGASLPSDVKMVLSVSPAVELVPAETWIPLFDRADVITMNVREKQAIEETLSGELRGANLRKLMKADAALVCRSGAMGCELQEHENATYRRLPAYRTSFVDTSGVGDTHIAVMCASMLLGHDLAQSCKRANAAGAIVVSHSTAFPVPTSKEVDRKVERGQLIDPGDK